MFIFILGMIISFQFINPRPKKANRSGDKFKVCRNMVINCWALQRRTERDTGHTKHSSKRERRRVAGIPFQFDCGPFSPHSFGSSCVVREFVERFLPMRHKSRSIFSTFGSVVSGLWLSNELVPWLNAPLDTERALFINHLAENCIKCGLFILLR